MSETGPSLFRWFSWSDNFDRARWRANEHTFRTALFLVLFQFPFVVVIFGETNADVMIVLAERAVIVVLLGRTFQRPLKHQIQRRQGAAVCAGSQRTCKIKTVNINRSFFTNWTSMPANGAV